MTKKEKTEEAILAAVRAMGHKVEFVEIWPQQGYWKQKRADVYTFEGSAQFEPIAGNSVIRVPVTSWDSMTNCARRGVKVDFVEGEFQVWSLPCTV